MALKLRVGASNMPQAGHTLYVYETGTTTIVEPIFSPDSTSATLTNPFTVPSSGWYGFEPPNNDRVDVYWTEGNRNLVEDVNCRDFSLELDDTVSPTIGESLTWDGTKWGYTKTLKDADIGVSVQGYDANLPTWPSTVNATEVGYLDGVTSGIQTQINGKQATLVSGVNIKTIGGVSVLGSGDLEVGGGGAWEYIGEIVASASGTVDITGLTSTYIRYKIVCNGVKTSYTKSPDSLNVIFQIGGSTWITSIVYYYGILRGGTTLIYTNNVSSHILVTEGVQSSETVDFIFEVALGPYPSISYYSSGTVDSGEYFIYGSGKYDSTNIITGVRFDLAIGNITGNFKLYGLKVS